MPVTEYTFDGLRWRSPFASVAMAQLASPAPVITGIEDRASVALSSIRRRVSPFWAGVGCSTFGRLPNENTEQAAAEKALDARYIRIPTRWNGSNIVSSAAYNNNRAIEATIRWYFQETGFRMILVIAGRDGDWAGWNDSDAGTIIGRLKTLGCWGDGSRYDIQGSNEPDLNGAGSMTAVADRCIALYNSIQAQAPGKRVWGPVWSNPGGDFAGFLSRLTRARCAGIDWHSYPGGSGLAERSIPQVWDDAARHGGVVDGVRSMLGTDWPGMGINVDEYNWSWQHATSDNALFTAANTVMQAIGYAEMIQAGSAVMAYATQNGDLSVMADTYQNPYGRPVSSPMPAYWGIAALTGGGMPGGTRLFPHYKDQAYTTTSSSAETKVYCFNNEAGGYNILLVNRREGVGRKVGVTPSALPAGTWLWRVHQTNPNTPFDPPTSSTWYDVPASGQLDIAMPKTSWAVIELKPGTAAPPPETTVPTAPLNVTTTSTGQTATIGWQPPATDGGQPVLGYIAQRDGTDANNGGPYATPTPPGAGSLPASARQFQFTLLRPGATYTLSTRAVSQNGLGPSKSVVVTVPSGALTQPTSVTYVVAGQTATIRWQPPTSDGGRAIIGYIAQRDGVDANNGGPYATPTPPAAGSLPASARAFQFTLLRRGSAYTLTVRAVTSAGAGPTQSVRVTIA